MIIIHTGAKRRDGLNGLYLPGSLLTRCLYMLYCMREYNA